MKAAAKRLARSCCPPALHRWWRRNFGWRWFRGDYASWTEARAASQGYDDDAVRNRALAAARAVRAGQAAWERDGTLFFEPAVHAPLLAALRKAAAINDGRLTVVDIGGAFGSVWWQHRLELAGLDVRWRVVEQPAFVAAGREFTDDILGFYPTIAAATADARPHVALMSSVLPYVESPRRLLAEAMAGGFDHIVIDRTPFHEGGTDRLVVQQVPPELGGGSYPAWIFNRAQLIALLAGRYDLVAEWPGFDDLDQQVSHRGFHFQCKPGSLSS